VKQCVEDTEENQLDNIFAFFIDDCRNGT